MKFMQIYAELPVTVRAAYLALYTQAMRFMKQEN